MPTSDSSERQERLRVYQCLYERHCVRLDTTPDGTRWLTDQFVLLDVTQSSVLLKDGELLPDGVYKYTQADGLKPVDKRLDFEAERWFRGLEQADWHEMFPTEWSVAEHPGKAMLWVARNSFVSYALLGEGTWTALDKHHENLCVEYTTQINHTAGLFRFTDLDRSKVVAYAAGIQVPHSAGPIAAGIASLTRQLAKS